MNHPCEKGCTGRSATCHATCEKYATFARERAERRDERHARLEITTVYQRSKERYKRIHQQRRQKHRQ